MLRAFERSRLRALSRWCFENDGFTKQAVKQVVRGVVGTSLRPHALTADEGWNRAAEENFLLKVRMLDATGRLSFLELCRGWIASQLVFGDMGIKLGSAESGFPIVQSIPAHRLGNWQNGPEDGALIDGVRVDAIGRPVSYRVLIADGDVQEIPASDFILFFDPHFPDQYRGTCEMGQALLKILDHDFVLSLETKGVFANLAPAIINYSESGDANLLDPVSSTTTGETYTMDKATGGMILHRKIGEKVEFVQPARPTPGLAEFQKALKDPAALALGVPVQWVIGDYTNTGAGIRAVISQADRRVAELQQLFADRVLNRLWFWITSKSIKAGDLPENPEKWRVRWQFPQKQTVDNGRDSNAARSDLFAGLRTFAEDFSERGRDWRDELEQKAIEAKFINELAVKYGVKREEIALLGNNPQPTQGQGDQAPQQNGDPKK